MSTKAKITFGTSCVISVAIITYVHVTHKLERDSVKVGVEMDIERQAKKKDNLMILEEQKKLTEALKKKQREDSS